MNSRIRIACLLLLLLPAWSAAQQRIINGQAANIEDHPWMAALLKGRDADATDAIICGASLIAPRFAVTAAHCVEGSSADELELLLGVSDLGNAEQGERIRVKAIVMHPGYFEPTPVEDVTADQADQQSVYGSATDDIAVLHLQRASTQTPIRLAGAELAGSFVADTPVVVSGWGNRSVTDEPDYPTVLEAVSLRVTDDAACDAVYEESLSARYLCAIGPATGNDSVRADSCTGDSGGPLVTQRDGQPTLIGIVSFGEACGSSTHPGVYNRVTRYASFIEEAIAATLVGDAQLRFGYVVSGETRADRVNVSNVSDDRSVQITPAQLVGDATVLIDNDSCSGRSLPPGESCSIGVSWTPNAAQKLAAALLIGGGDGLVENRIRVDLDGTVVFPADVSAPLDAPELPFFSDAAITWTSISDNTAEGNTALRADGLGTNSVDATLVARVPGPGTLHYAHRGRDAALSVVVGQATIDDQLAEPRWTRASVSLEAASDVIILSSPIGQMPALSLDAFHFESATAVQPDDVNDTTVGERSSGGGGAISLWLLATLITFRRRCTAVMGVPCGRCLLRRGSRLFISVAVSLSVWLSPSTLALAGSSLTTDDAPVPGIMSDMNNDADHPAEATEYPLATVVGFSRTREEIVFEVMSYGCTNRASLQLTVQALENGELEIALLRVRPDRCRRMPFAKPFAFRLDELGIASEQLRLKNPIHPPFRR